MERKGARPVEFPPMSNATSLSCIICGKEYAASQVLYTCPSCGPDGVLDVLYDYSALSAKVFPRTDVSSLWRYRDMLPVEADQEVPPLRVGWTPLYAPERLRAILGLSALFLKDDTVNPTASFKDRASAVGVAVAMALGMAPITCASTGNAASSLAGICASQGIETIIFVPETAPRAKVVQLLMFGARVFTVRGTYDDAFDLSMEATRLFGWYNRNTSFNPYLLEGKKTVSLEIWEQLGENVPDFVYVPVGDGCILGGVWKGFEDLRRMGKTEKMPTLVGVQAEGSQAVTRAWKTGALPEKIVCTTFADSISVGIPRAWRQAVRAVSETGGEMITVSDDEIAMAMGILARESGIFSEPAGATAFAGILKSRRGDSLSPDASVVALVTGAGLKDIDGAVRACTSQAVSLEPDVEALKEAVGEGSLRRS